MAIALIKTALKKVESNLETARKSKNKKEVLVSLNGTSDDLKKTVQHLKVNNKRQLVKTRNQLLATANFIDGVVNGLESQSLTRPEMLKHFNVLEDKFMSKILSLASDEAEKDGVDTDESNSSETEVETSDKIRMIAKSGDWKDALKTIKGAIHAKMIEGETPEAATVILNSLASKRKDLPLKLTEPYKVVRMPIIPIFSNPQLNNTETFKKLGVQFLPIEGYGILLDQMLIAVSKKIAARYEVEPEEMATGAVQLFNEKADIGYDLVSNKAVTNPRNTDIQLFWIMPSRKVTQLIKLAGKNAMNVSWGLPF